MQTTPLVESANPPRPSIGGVARLALWLGCVGFGGGYAVLAQLRFTVVDRFNWLTEDEYADAISVAQSLPGASGANFFTLLGMRTHGVRGGVLSTVLFLAPSTMLMVLFGVFYDRLRNAKQLEAIFTGMNQAVVAVIASVAWVLVRKARKPWQIGLAFLAVIAVESGMSVLQVVALTVLGALGLHAVQARKPQLPVVAVFPIAILPQLLVVFLRIGAGTLGGGMAMIPILDHEVVEQLGWLTRREFSDAVTLGQITPGPVAITATFVGYRLAGPVGALIATAATFLPALLATLLVGKSIDAFRNSTLMTFLFDVLAPVTAGLVAAAALSLFRASVHSWQDSVVVVASFAAMRFRKFSPLLVLIVAALVRVATRMW